MVENKIKKLSILVVLLIIILAVLLFTQKPVSNFNVDLNQNNSTQVPFVVYEVQAGWSDVVGGGNEHITVLSNGDGNMIKSVSVGCNITPFTLSLNDVKNIQNIIINNKLYDSTCLVAGGTDYYVKYAFGNGTQQWFINKDSYLNWVSPECIKYFDQIGEIIFKEVTNQQSKKYYSTECN